MTLTNWISIGVTAVIFIAGIILWLYYKKKLKDLDGFIGILPPEKGYEEDDDDNE